MRGRTAALALIALAGSVGAATAGDARQPTHGCPATDARAPVSHRAGAARALVPHGARSVVICGYHGAGVGSGQANPLRATRVVTARRDVRRLARELDAIEADPPGSVRSCPADRGEGSVIAWFRYRSGPRNPITVRLGGCQPVTNGRLDRLGLSPSGAPAVSDLRRLARPN